VEGECLVDTGSDVSILRKFIFNNIKNVILERCASKLRGLGKKITYPVGYFLAEVAVDQAMKPHKFVVVEDEDIEYDALLGFDFVSKFVFPALIPFLLYFLQLKVDAFVNVTLVNSTT